MTGVINNSIKNNRKERRSRTNKNKPKKLDITMASMQAVGEIGNLLFEGAAEKRQIEMDDLDREYSAKEAAEGNLQQRLEDELAAKKNWRIK